MDAHAGFVFPVGWNVTREKEEAACLKSLPFLTQRDSSVVEVRNGSAALPCLGGGVLRNMERLHEDASGADGHTTHLPLDYGHTNLYRRQNVIEAHTGKSMGEAG